MITKVLIPTMLMLSKRYFFEKMQKNGISTILVILMPILLISCNGKLTKSNAEQILIKSYKINDNLPADGGIITTINYLIADSIHQDSDTARVFFRVNGSIENGSKYSKSLDGGEKEAFFKRRITGWQLQ
jgi:hypothetical protein